MRWNDLFSLTLALTVPFVLLAIFPWQAMGVLTGDSHARARVRRDSCAGCAFVTLTPEEEGRARTAARAAWQHDRGAMRRLRIDLFEDALPPLSQRPAIPISDRSAFYPHDSVRTPYEPDPLPPTLAAPRPATIKPSGESLKPVPAFSREELLTLPTYNN